ncbi:hypothetical protein [Pseudomonas sp. MWU12-2345]|uniref:hypothetical protein n=1 Tax=Pseudomonas sp. MWU12-2345 TaxID=2928689 RepID=UPI00200D4447|nr:hypothetical protein [Pseudomonas sp. MWU12-2345]
MNEVTLALGYVVYVLHNFWRQGVDRPIEVGTVLEVGRSERNNLVAGQVARDATDAEIAQFRGLPPPDDEEPLDAAEALAALGAAQAQLATVADAAKGLETQVADLQKVNGELTKERDELLIEVGDLRTANAAQAKALETANKKAAAKGAA